jgi:hypothetical protein
MAAERRIPRIPDKTSAQFFEEFYCNELPVIITGFARACATKWTSEHVQSILGTRGSVPIGGAVLADYPITSLFPEPDAYSFSSVLAAGAPSAKTICHFEWTNNFVGMIRGVKHVTLLPPRSEQVMAVSDELRAKLAAGGGEVFGDPPDLDLVGGGGRPMHAHPVFASCPYVLCETLTEGDVVFFPAYWFHYVHDLTSSISVTTQTCSYDG